MACWEDNNTRPTIQVFKRHASNELSICFVWVVGTVGAKLQALLYDILQAPTTDIIAYAIGRKRLPADGQLLLVLAIDKARKLIY